MSHAAPDGRIMHAEIKLGDQIVFLADDFPEFCGGKSRNPRALGESSVTLHQCVPDVDARYQRAIDAGCAPMMPPEDMFWGDRYAIVTDPYGHHWSFATHVRDVSPEEMEQAAAAAFSQPS